MDVVLISLSSFFVCFIFYVYFNNYARRERFMEIGDIIV